MREGIPRRADPLDLARAAVREYFADEMPTYAAALSYQVFFSLFPFLVFLLGLLSFLNFDRAFDLIIQQAGPFLPAAALDKVVTVIGEIRDRQQTGLLSLGIVTAIWFASAGVRSTMGALNKAYDVAEARPLARRYAASIVYTVALAALVVTATTMLVIGPGLARWLFQWVGLGERAVIAWRWTRMPVAGALLTLAISLVYHFGPNVRQRFRLVTPGAVVAVALWIVAALGFSLYVSHFARYSLTYGSIGAVIVLMLYILISSSVLLFGAELNAEIYHRRRRGPCEETASTAAPPSKAR